MNSPAFEITPNEPSSVEWLKCRLFLQVGSHYLYYVILDDQDTLIVLKYHQFAGKNNAETMDFLQQILNDDNVLKQEFLQCNVLFHSLESCLLPAIYHSAHTNKEVFELMHGDLDQSPVFSDKISGWNIYNLYKVPEGVRHYFETRFPSAKFSHYHSLLLEEQFQQETNSQPRVHVIFYPKQIVTAVFANGQVQLIQNFNYQKTEDISWYLLNIVQRFNLSQIETPVEIAGMIDKNSALFEELLKYFFLIRVISIPKKLKGIEQLQAYPDHFFSPLLKLAACAS